MPSYQNNQIGMAALMLLLASASPALAQRMDADQPISLIENAPTDASVVLKQDAPNQVAETSTAVDQSELIEADLDPKISPVDNTLAETSSAYAQVTLGRRKISEVGLAAIGVGDGDAIDRGLDSMIWRGTPASDAVFLLEKAAVISHSQAVTDLSYRVVVVF